MIRSAALSLLVALSGTFASGAPVAYDLDRQNSSVGFTVGFGGDQITGTLPVATADIVLDFDAVRNSRVSVTLDARAAKAGFPFATQALRGPKVLASERFPTMTFATRDLSADGRKASVRGDLTIRGVTRPVVLQAQIFRQQGAESGDRSRLAVHLSGVVQRSAFGADGWSDMVGDTVGLDIRVRIQQAE
jgi:polyisoprenoid-binding protein YceI